MKISRGRKVNGTPFAPINKVCREMVLYGIARIAAPFDIKFLQSMVNRLYVGRVRYGPATPLQEYMKRAKKAIAHYEATGNIDYLVDLANYAWLEAMHPSHSNAHYVPGDSAGRTTLKGD